MAARLVRHSTCIPNTVDNCEKDSWFRLESFADGGAGLIDTERSGKLSGAEFLKHRRSVGEPWLTEIHIFNRSKRL
jgi:hypothetical protein